MKSAIILAAMLVGTAHAQSLEDQARAAAIADVATTITGLALGAAEANPLGLAAMALKIPVMAHVKTLPDVDQADSYASIAAIWGGASANNLCIIGAILTGGAFAAVCPVIGIVWGVHKWQQTSEEREFFGVCRYYRQENPDIKCEYTNYAKKG